MPKLYKRRDCKMKKSVSIFIITVFLLFVPTQVVAKCIATPVNMIKILGSICWSCMLPLEIAGIPVLNGPLNNKPIISYGSQPICMCPMPQIGRAHV